MTHRDERRQEIAARAVQAHARRLRYEIDMWLERLFAPPAVEAARRELRPRNLNV